MQEPNDFDRSLFVIETIDNSVRAYNDFSKVFIFKFRHNSTEFRKFPKFLCVLDQET